MRPSGPAFYRLALPTGACCCRWIPTTMALVGCGATAVASTTGCVSKTCGKNTLTRPGLCCNALDAARETAISSASSRRVEESREVDRELGTQHRFRRLPAPVDAGFFISIAFQAEDRD